MTNDTRDGVDGVGADSGADSSADAATDADAGADAGAGADAVPAPVPARVPGSGSGSGPAPAPAPAPGQPKDSAVPQPDAAASSSFIKLMAKAAAVTARRQPDAERPAPTPAPATPAPRPRRRRRRDTLPGVAVPKGIRKGIRGSFRRIVNEVESKAAESTRRRVLWPVYLLRISVQVLRQWARDRCPQQAASLAFQTVLSIVPIIAVTMAVLRTTNNFDAESSLVTFLANEFIPVSPDEISAKLLSWSGNINLESLGLVGMITTVILAFLIVNSLERVTNFIWRAEHKRSLAQKFIIFYATATIGPVLIGTGLYQAGKVGLTQGSWGLLLSFGTSFGALFLANYFLPACRVRLKSAIIGALVSTILFETAKLAFSVYVTNFAFAKFAGIYGTLAMFPLWLLWIYYSWLTLLLGFEVAHAAQNLHLLERIDRRGTMSLENELLSRVNGVVAARVMVAIAEGFIRGDKVITRQALETRFDLSDEVLTRITNRLTRADLIIEVEGTLSGFIPARPPSEISLASVFRTFRGDDVVVTSTSGPNAKLDKVLGDIEADTLQRTGRLYLDELI